jgi:oligoribonuclease NrnB/cAMP/cGMP phosphodiesterase (DHH superfamily)
MAGIEIEKANDAFAVALESLTRAVGEVRRYIAKIREIDYELEEWKKINPRYLEDEELRYLYENKKNVRKESNDLLNQACDRMDKENELMREAREHCFQLNQAALQVVPSDNCVPESFRDMTSIQRRQRGSQEEMKEALVSLPHQKSSIANKEESLGSLNAAKNADHPNIVSNFVVALGTHTDGLNPTSFEFKRDDILEKIFNWIQFQESRFLLLDSPAASGKLFYCKCFNANIPN